MLPRTRSDRGNPVVLAGRALADQQRRRAEFYGCRGGGIGWDCRRRSAPSSRCPTGVVALIGDGSAMYTVQGLWTAARYRLPIVWVIFNNTAIAS